MKRRDLERHLVDHGCAPLREGAHHAIWGNPDTPSETAARPAEVKPVPADLGAGQDAPGGAPRAGSPSRGRIWLVRSRSGSRDDGALGRVLAGRHLLGLTLAGWGTLNLVEGTVDHHILGLHPRQGGRVQGILDLAILALGAVLLVGGLLMARAGERAARNA